MPVMPMRRSGVIRSRWSRDVNPSRSNRAENWENSCPHWTQNIVILGSSVAVIAIFGLGNDALNGPLACTGDSFSYRMRIHGLPPHNGCHLITDDCAVLQPCHGMHHEKSVKTQCNRAVHTYQMLPKILRENETRVSGRWTRNRSGKLRKFYLRILEKKLNVR